MTLPVNFDDTVASRRATTYPDAFRIAPGAEGPPDFTVAGATLTAAAFRLTDQYHTPPPASSARTTMVTIGPVQLRPPPRSSRSMRSDAKSLEISVIDV